MMTFHACCVVIMAAGRDPKFVRQVNYAVGYAEAGRRMTDPHEIAVQCLYLLNNISRWRAPQAALVRAALRHYSTPAG